MLLWPRLVCVCYAPCSRMPSPIASVAVRPTLVFCRTPSLATPPLRFARPAHSVHVRTAHVRTGMGEGKTSASGGGSSDPGEDTPAGRDKDKDKDKDKGASSKPQYHLDEVVETRERRAADKAARAAARAAAAATGSSSPGSSSGRPGSTSRSLPEASVALNLPAEDRPDGVVRLTEYQFRRFAESAMEQTRTYQPLPTHMEPTCTFPGCVVAHV